MYKKEIIITSNKYKTFIGKTEMTEVQRCEYYPDCTNPDCTPGKCACVPGGTNNQCKCLESVQ